jgi:hypothetical protein
MFEDGRARLTWVRQPIPLPRELVSAARKWLQIQSPDQASGGALRSRTDHSDNMSPANSAPHSEPRDSHADSLRRKLRIERILTGPIPACLSVDYGSQR